MNRSFGCADVYVFCHVVNLALNRPASQSSTYGQETANRATNGNIDDWSSTNGGSLAKWWMVELDREYTIDRVEITRRSIASKSSRQPHNTGP